MTTFNVNKAVGTFSRSLGNGAAAGRVFAEGIDHVIATGDTTVIARMREVALSKGDTHAARAISATFGKIYEGAKTVSNKDGKVSIRIKDATLSNSAVDALHSLVAEGVSLRGEKWAKAFKDETEDTPRTAAELAGPMLKRAMKNGVTLAALIVALKEAAKAESEKERAKAREEAAAA